MSIVGLEYKRVFGLNGESCGSIYHSDEEQIYFPSGSTVVAFNQETKVQKFLHSNEGIVAIGMSPNRKWLAVSESSKTSVCAVYDLANWKKRKTLALPVTPGTTGSIAQTSNGPDYNIHIWLWEKAKIVASIKSTASNSVNQVVYQTLFNPGDNSQVSIVGNGIFRLFRLVENTLKPSPPKLEQKNVLCHTWTLDERVVCGTGEGKVYIFETNGELKYEFLHATLVPNPTGTPLPTPQQIHAISSFSKGILVAGGGGLVTLYERGDLLSGKELFRKSRNYTLPDPLTITKLSISPSEEAFVCQSESNQLYHSQITSEPKLDQMSLTILGDSLHSNSITGLDSCIRKSLVATSSSDSIRIWNYFDDKSEITKLFSDLVLTISFHPSGLYILVGFQDSLKLMNVLDNDLSVLREFPLKSVKVTSFSTGGQYFAASSYNMVYIYSTWTFEVLGTLKGHTGLITSISWVSDDSRIVTVGNEGGIYDWDLKDMSNYQGIGIKRQYEYVERGCMYTSICLGVDKKTIYAVGSDNTLKEVVEGRLKRQLNSDITLTNVCISNSGKFLITGTQNGSIRVIKHPFGEEDFNSFQEYFVHAGPITQLQISFDDQFLFSTGHDGCLFIFRIDSGSSKNFIYADEILVTRADLEEKNMIFNDLKTRAEELKMENDYQLRLKDLNFNEKIKQVTEKFVQEVDALKINATVLRDDKDKEESRHDEEMGETRKQHAKDLLDLENSQNTKITVEYQKIEALERLTAAQQSEWELSTKEMQTYREKTLKELNLHYDQQLKEKQSEMDMLREEIKRQSEEYEEIYKETEEDADRELVDLRNRFEKRYREEKEIVAKLKTDNAVMRKKYNALQAEIDSHKGEITKLNGEEKKMLLVIKTLEKDIAGLKNEIHERDETIQDKEKRIFDLKKKNQELEKFKFVLDYKIKELKKQIEPRENDITLMTAQIAEMDLEFQNFSKTTKELELSIADLKSKLKACGKEIVKERDQIKKGETVIKNFQFDLQELQDNFQNPKLLKSSLKKLYQRYCKDDKPSELLDRDVQEEYKRQREYLERSIDSLQKNAAKEKAGYQQEKIRFLQENVILISEMNEILALKSRSK